MQLKIKKLGIFLSFVILGLFFTIALDKGQIFASEGHDRITSTIIDNLSFNGRFTLSPDDVNRYHFASEKMIVKAFRIDKGREIHGEVLLSGKNEADLAGSARLMVSHISKTYPFITRERFETGSGANKISYREWGTVNSDTDTGLYQNLIVQEEGFTWYIIFIYQEDYRSEVDKIIRSVNFTI